MRGIPLSIYQIKKGKENKKRKNSKGTVVSNGIETTKIEKITNSETDLVFNLVQKKPLKEIFVNTFLKGGMGVETIGSTEQTI